MTSIPPSLQDWLREHLAITKPCTIELRLHVGLGGKVMKLCRVVRSESEQVLYQGDKPTP